MMKRVLFLLVAVTGYGTQYGGSLAEQGEFERRNRRFFAKISYAFQR